MTPEQIEFIAQQLRKPEGEHGVTIAEKMNVGNRGMNLHTLAVVDPKPNEHILEIGMANGYFVSNILNLNDSISYVGCDYSEDMVRMARDHNESFVNENRAEFVHADVHNLPFENSSFDTIFTINTLYFWDQRDLVINELNRVLKSTGKLVIAFRPDYIMRQYPFAKHNFQLYNSEELLSLIAQNGFGLSDITHVVEPKQILKEENMQFDRETVIFECRKSLK